MNWLCLPLKELPLYRCSWKKAIQQTHEKECFGVCQTLRRELEQRCSVKYFLANFEVLWYCDKTLFRAFDINSQTKWFWNRDQISKVNSVTLALFNQRNFKPSSCFTFSVQSMLRQYGPSVPEELLHKLVNAFGELRSRADQGLISYPYSTREVVSVVKHLQVRLLLPILFPGSLGPCTAQ